MALLLPAPLGQVLVASETVTQMVLLARFMHLPHAGFPPGDWAAARAAAGAELLGETVRNVEQLTPVANIIAICR